MPALYQPAHTQGSGTLAGSCATLHDTFRTLIHTLRVPVPAAAAMVATAPAARAGLHHIGR